MDTDSNIDRVEPAIYVSLVKNLKFFYHFDSGVNGIFGFDLVKVMSQQNEFLREVSVTVKVKNFFEEFSKKKIYYIINRKI